MNDPKKGKDEDIEIIENPDGSITVGDLTLEDFEMSIDEILNSEIE